VIFGNKSNDPPDLSQGLRPGTPLHIFKKARLPQAGPPRAPRSETRVRVERPRLDPTAPPPPAPPHALRRAVALGGAVWLAGSVAEALLGRWYVGLVGAGIGAFALLHARDIGLTGTDARLPDSRSASVHWWWLVPTSTVFVVARIGWLLATREW
jgi:hypothetical protein